MINELTHRQQHRFIVACIAGALVIHALIFIGHVFVPHRLWHITALPSYVSLPKTMSILDSRQLAKLLPRRRATKQAPLISSPANIPVGQVPPPMTQVLQRAPDEPTHKVYRAGTGFDAPMTEHALIVDAGGGPGSGGRPRREPAREQRSQVEQIQTAGQPTSFTDPSTVKQLPAKHGAPGLLEAQPGVGGHVSLAPIQGPIDSDRMVLYRHGITGADQQTQLDQAVSVTEPALHERSSRTATTLNFLSEKALFEHMRSHVLTDEPERELGSSAGSSAMGPVGGGAGFGSGGVASQYGDPRFLFYNRKIYQALQQSMNIEVQKLTNVQFGRMMHGVKAPTRIRFALDADGHIKDVRVVESSGNYYYDILSQAIVKEASYPPIPRSFGMHTTYHAYGIILYHDASIPSDTIGVSPYLEGE